MRDLSPPYLGLQLALPRAADHVILVDALPLLALGLPPGGDVVLQGTASHTQKGRHVRQSHVRQASASAQGAAGRSAARARRPKPPAVAASPGRRTPARSRRCRSCPCSCGSCAQGCPAAGVQRQGGRKRRLGDKGPPGQLSASGPIRSCMMPPQAPQAAVPGTCLNVAQQREVALFQLLVLELLARAQQVVAALACTAATRSAGCTVARRRLAVRHAWVTACMRGLHSLPARPSAGAVPGSCRASAHKRL